MSKKKNKTIEELLEESLVPVEEIPYYVPNNWVYFYFTSILDIQGGTQPPKSQFINEHFEGYTRLIQIRDFASDKYITYVPINKKLRLIEDDDVLIARYGASTGRILTGLSGAYNVALAKVVFPKNYINREFLYWLLKTENFQSPLRAISRSAQSGFNKNDLSYFKLPLPPLNEQKRIAEKVERLLSKIDEAKELIEEAEETINIQFSTVLSKAFVGDLSLQWREHNDNEVVFEEFISQLREERIALCKGNKDKEYISAKFNFLQKPKYLPKGWVVVTFDMICDNITKGTTPNKTDLTFEGDIPYLKVYNIIANKIDFDYKPSFIPEIIHNSKLKRSVVYPGDILMNIVGPPLGKIALVPPTYPEWNINQALAIFRPINGVLNEYIYYTLLYEKTLADVFQATRGVVGQSNISLEQCRNLKIALPPLNEQVEIVKRIKYLFEKLQKVDKNIREISYLLDTTVKSILEKAFRGELGTNEPTEESAIELLKKVLEQNN